ncbi:glycosyltransferase family 2 protein [Leclercia sp. LSNIH6]|nr:glycosyltransferase family 2 protein [Leclercia sp. LSNIH6]POW50380.1 glycosyltransferase family 2 protein [Leclercia sp. LSNIH8]
MRAISKMLSWLNFSFKPKLKPKKDLIKITSSTWSAISEDPAFLVLTKNVKLCDWYMVNLNLTLSCTIANAKLYIDNGKDYNQEEQITLPLHSGKLAKRILYLKTPPKRLRFDPCEAPMEFSINEFSLTKLTAAKAKALMLKKLNGNVCAKININELYQQYNIFLDVKYSPITYQNWLAKNSLATYAASLPVIADSNYQDKPLFSIVLATYNSDINYLKACIDSVQQQRYENWQLCIADDASINKEIHELLIQYSTLDPRIIVTIRNQNGHISQASNSALSLATGNYIAFIDHDDLLSPFALQVMAYEINKNTSAQFFYSDEDKIDEYDQRFSPHFKPDWNRDLFYSHNYITHFTIIKKSLVDKVGGFRTGVEGSQDYDLFLRAIAQLEDNQIIHVPHILYHWRAISGSTALSSAEKNYTSDAGLKALSEFFTRNHPDVSVTQHELNNCYRVEWPIPKTLPLVSLFIPTRDRVDLLERCVETILHKTTYSFYEIIIINNQSTCTKTLNYLRKISDNKKVRVINYEQPFNFSSINNFAATHAEGSIFGLINNDIEVLSPGWLDEMVRQVSRPDIGCVGAKLFYPDMRIQHAGVVLGIGGVAGHSHKFFRQHHHGYHSRLSLVQNYSAVTAAALLVRKSVFEEVGGMETELSVAFNDVDFCLKVREAGYRNLWTPFAELIHHESVSRGYEDNPEKQARFKQEVDYMVNKWGSMLVNDPCYNPNLSLTHEDFSYRI